MREVRAKGALPIWREDADGRRFSLILTRAGRDAIGVEEAAVAKAATRVEVGQSDIERGADPCGSGAGERDGALEPVAKCDGAAVAKSGACVTPASPDGVAAAGEDDASSAGEPQPKKSKASPRVGSKQALVVNLLSNEEGATIDQLTVATGWLPHTTRAALTGLRKRGFEIARTASESGGSLYRIVTATPTQA
ncbi:DUF3489 domain-containing protein [Methylosinus sp. KRF6]|nr:DUF3489 domain-containing protein [Methylosinus sp. KRF6]